MGRAPGKGVDRGKEGKERVQEQGTGAGNGEER